MTAVRKSVIVPHPAGTMYGLVADFERYPEFLPWCRSATVLSREGHVLRGQLGIDFRGFRAEITTVNHEVPGKSIALALEDGPFEEFKGLWTFSPLGDTGSPASDSTLGPTSGLNVDGQHHHIWDTVVPTFLHYNLPLLAFGWVAAMVL